MNDGTANFDDAVDLIEKAASVTETGEKKEVEIRKLNRHERRKQAKLARMLAMKEKLEEEKLKAESSKLKGKRNESK